MRRCSPTLHAELPGTGSECSAKGTAATSRSRKKTEPGIELVAQSSH